MIEMDLESLSHVGGLQGDLGDTREAIDAVALSQELSKVRKPVRPDRNGKSGSSAGGAVESTSFGGATTRAAALAALKLKYVYE